MSYNQMTDVTYEDIERMEIYYDCSCKVIMRICGQSYANKGLNFSLLKWRMFIYLFKIISILCTRSPISSFLNNYYIYMDLSSYNQINWSINEILITWYCKTSNLECTTKPKFILNINKRIFSCLKVNYYYRNMEIGILFTSPKVVALKNQ